MVFDELHPKIKEAIEEKGWEDPTPVQNRASPLIMDGESTLVLAPTGIGKTESAMLPIFSLWAEDRPEPISVLYITPLRALNRDLFQRLRWWAGKIDMDITVRHGDTTKYERRKQAEFPSHTFITTPETLQAILTAPKLREVLPNVEWVVIDEIHELVGNKRGSQLSVGLERLRELAGDFQVIGLSATVGSPEEVAGFLGDDIEIVNATAAKDLDIQVVSPSPTEEDKRRSGELFTSPEVAARLRVIEDGVSEHESSLVFTNTRQGAEIISSRLAKVEKEWDHDIHHSSLGKEVRIEAEDSFKDEETKALVCTSSLELGIDIGSIDLVVQYMSPRRATRLVQRVGRSGHEIGRESKGLLVAGDADDIMESAVVAKRALEGDLEPTEIHPTPLDVLGHQIVGLSIEEYEQTDKRIYNTLNRAHPYRDLSREEFDEVLDYMADLGFIWNDRPADDGGYEVHRRRKAWKYYYKNLSTIPDVYQYQVVNNIDGTDVGVLDEAFVAEHADPGTEFIVKGSPWRILSVHEGKVEVEPASDVGSAIPAWEGEMIPVPYETAQEVGRMRRRVAEMIEEGETDGEIIDGLTDEYPMDEDCGRKVLQYIRDQVEEGKEIPSDENVVLEGDDDFVVLHTCFGSLINATISRFFATLMASELGHSVAIKNDPYRIVFRGVEREEVRRILDENGPEDLRATVLRTLDYTQMFRWRMLHVAKRFGAIRRRAKWDKINLKKMIRQFEDTPVFDEATNEVLFDKLQLSETEQLFAEVKKGDREVVTADGVSPVGKRGVDYHFRDLIAPETPEKEIFETFRSRLLNTEVRLICMQCGDYRVTKTLRSLDDDPECPSCSSGMIGVLKHDDREGEEIAKKGIGDKDLSEEEEERFSKIRDTAELVLTYGRKAVLCLAGHGVGPETAIRVMAKQQETEEDLMEDILEAERQFAKTKKYWN